MDLPSLTPNGIVELDYSISMVKRRKTLNKPLLILDKGIYELSIVLDLIVRNKQNSRSD